MALICNFVPIFGAGRLALSERPKLKEIQRLASDGCDRVVTILGPGEQAGMIGEQVASCGMRWEWLKVGNAGRLTDGEKALFRKSVGIVEDAVLSGESVLVHCSAGLHRTGMFANALLRKGCVPQDRCLEIIGETRRETRDALEEKYIILAEDLY